MHHADVSEDTCCRLRPGGSVDGVKRLRVSSLYGVRARDAARTAITLPARVWDWLMCDGVLPTTSALEGFQCRERDYVSEGRGARLSRVRETKVCLS